MSASVAVLAFLPAVALSLSLLALDADDAAEGDAGRAGVLAAATWLFAVVVHATFAYTLLGCSRSTIAC